MEIIDIYKEGNVIIMKIAPEFNKSDVHTIILDNHVDNRLLLHRFRALQHDDLKAKHG